MQASRTTSRLVGISLVSAAAFAAWVWGVRGGSPDAAEPVVDEGSQAAPDAPDGAADPGAADTSGAGGAGDRKAERIERFADRPGLLLYVRKSEGTLLLLRDGYVLGRYDCVLGRNTKDKVKSGDLATPEGEFYVCRLVERGGLRRLRLSYPNAEDAARGLRDRLITQREHDEIARAVRDRKEPPQGTRLGGYIAIYGPRSRSETWTRGGAALSGRDMNALTRAVQVGTPVLIEP